MMKLEQSKNLKSAFVLLKCSKDDHDDCRAIRNAMLDEFSNIHDAYTTNAKIDGEIWCVAASALIQSDKTEEFRNKLWKLTANENTTKIKDIRLFLDE